MKIVPDSISRFGGRTLLKLNVTSPTLLVVAGVVGLGATAVLAAKATRHVDPIIDEHKKARVEIGYVRQNRAGQQELVKLYSRTGFELTKLYGPTLVLGTASTVAVLGGHKILRGRHIATMAAYSGLMDQFSAYRGRVVKTIGTDLEKAIYEGAHGEYQEDPDHKGEYKLTAKWDGDPNQSYLRPWFDETNVHWTRDPVANCAFLKGMQAHMNNMLKIRGHVTLNDVYDALRMERTKEGMVAGWVYNSKTGDNFVDFGFLGSEDPHTVAFRNGLERTVRLNFNIDGNIQNLI